MLVLPAAGQTATGFDALVDEFLDRGWYPYRPSEGTSMGFHQYDSSLEDLSAAARQRRTRVLKEYRQRFASLHTAGWPLQRQIDREIVLSTIDGALLELEEVRMWEKDPDLYPSALSYAAFVLISRKFASPESRLESLILREEKMPAWLRSARDNLRDPPRVYTEVALMQLPGILDFFRKDVPLAFSEVKDAALMERFRRSNLAVIAALEEYQRFLQQDLLPRSQGDFRLGAERYRKKLLYEEMVDTPLEQLLEIGCRDLRLNQERFREAAEQLHPGKPPRDVLELLARRHPPPDRLLDAFREEVARTRRFIEAHDIVTIPSPVPPIVQETPPFMRALTFASMDTPGPYEKNASEAYFNVTLPESTWSPQEVAEHMAGFTYGTIASTAVHEAYPGHYAQFLWVPSAPSKVSKLFGAGANVEGWAHYTEEMMLDEGYGIPPGGDRSSPEFLELRLGQLQDALLRNARFIVGIEMHTGAMSFDQGVEFFIKEGYQTRANALRETRRGTSDPTYLIYTLGKLQILELREEFRHREGAGFRLKDFHDRFLGAGYPPIKLVRRILLGE
ncbi:MAG: DUF885 domain-containing protein [Armatimonadetes bacterium]|nr:DUF885 domain-containing protein [Armatimonadota bacterium]